ncbi:hypothetical protein [Pseudactinotalea sp. Z1748]|uniref:hypothetical protein n=1 Tax=Pseudactinotalea sp. Z1748 TaxID=3413027 RepID=UPI003C7ED766
MSRRRFPVAAAILTGVMLVVGCTEEPGEPATFPEEGPRWLVISTGEGFSEGGDGEVPDGWVPLLTHDDGCSLAGYGVQIDEPLEDARATTADELDELLESEDLPAGDIREEEFIISGGVSEEYDTLLPFMVADGLNDDGGEVRFASRAGSRVHYSGDVTTDLLHLRLACPGSIQEHVWDEARTGLRPGMSIDGVTPDDPWGAVSG